MGDKEFFNWTDDLSVKVNELDEQHKKLFGLCNEFYNAVLEKKSMEITSSKLDKLMDYAYFHFNTEENYFDKFNYPKKDTHKYLHQETFVKLKKLKREFEEEKLEISFQFISLMKQWITGHIQKEDIQYSECFIANGLK